MNGSARPSVTGWRPGGSRRGGSAAALAAAAVASALRSVAASGASDRESRPRAAAFSRQRVTLGGLEARLLAERAARVVGGVGRGVGQRAVEDVQQRVVLPQGQAEREEERGDADEHAPAQLVEVLDEREALIVRDRCGDDPHATTRRAGTETTSGSGARRGRRRRRISVGERLVVVVAADRALELAQALADGAADLGQLLGPEHEQGDDEYEDEFHGSDVRHAAAPVSGRPRKGGVWAYEYGARPGVHRIRPAKR